MLRVTFFTLLLLTGPRLSVVAETLAVEAFAGLPDLYGLDLSPSGEKLIFHTTVGSYGDSGSAIKLIDLETGESEFLVVTDNKKFKINWSAWAGNNKVLISARFPAKRQGTPTTETRLLVKHLDSGKLENELPWLFGLWL